MPTSCDATLAHTGYAEHPRVAGWPKLLAGLEDDALNAAKEASRYFDCVNMATRIQAPGVMTVGYIDQACPPTSVYAA